MDLIFSFGSVIIQNGASSPTQGGIHILRLHRGSENKLLPSIFASHEARALYIMRKMCLQLWLWIIKKDVTFKILYWERFSSKMVMIKAGKYVCSSEWFMESEFPIAEKWPSAPWLHRQVKVKANGVFAIFCFIKIKCPMIKYLAPTLFSSVVWFLVPNFQLWINSL